MDAPRELAELRERRGEALGEAVDEIALRGVLELGLQQPQVERQRDELLLAEREAREARRGLWAGEFENPGEWRKRETPNGGARTSVNVGKIKLADAEDAQMLRGADGLFRTADGEPLPTDEAVRAQTQAIEGSNVNAVEAMVGMISLARQFDMQMKMLQNADANDRQATQLLSMR